jgi:hypothetical protein
LTSTGIYILGIATAGQEANIAFSKKEPTTKHTGIPSSSEQSETGTSYQPAQLLQLPSRSLGLTLGLPHQLLDMNPMYIILIVKIWNVLDVNRLGG